jgi:hypothetical protein
MKVAASHGVCSSPRPGSGIGSSKARWCQPFPGIKSDGYVFGAIADSGTEHFNVNIFPHALEYRA